jgi:acetyl-CoA acetyltransferase
MRALVFGKSSTIMQQIHLVLEKIRSGALRIVVVTTHPKMNMLILERRRELGGAIDAYQSSPTRQ